jgi:glyoxylase-like metal-dependent hydrolase (beta-lactamase superfamily II)
MGLIEFFGLKIKPKMSKGKYLFAPLGNLKITDNIYAVRDKDVNAFVYKKGNDCIAIDCGYKNSDRVSQGLKILGIDEGAVTDLFLTHVDLDHAGGVDIRCNRVFPKAKVYLSAVEEGYLHRKLYRKKLAFIGLKTPIKLAEGYRLLHDGQTTMCGSIKVHAILVPGHTIGHTCYLIDDKYLFSGDSLILVKGEGFAFYKLWNVDTKLAIKSLEKLKTLNGVEMVITSHSGYTTDLTAAFLYTAEPPDRNAKGFKVSDDAPFDPFE